ncbi:integrase, catalytic region, zinc finger, CCHC-type containing protein [Tanacetum coccineum]
MNHQTLTIPQVIPQVAYQSPQAHTQPMTESPFGDSAVASSRFPTTNNQLRTSSNPRNQATIQDGRITVQQVQGIQGQNYSGTTYKSNATSSRGNTTSRQARVIRCYNCQGEGHMARQCTQPKRPRNAAWYKEKTMLAEAQEAGQILDEEQLAFLADPGILADQAQTIIPHNAASNRDLAPSRREQDKSKTAFRTTFMATILVRFLGYMPFCLTNAPAVFYGFDEPLFPRVPCDKFVIEFFIDDSLCLPPKFLKKSIDIPSLRNGVGDLRPEEVTTIIMDPIKMRDAGFEELKLDLCPAPILTLPSCSDGFQIYSDGIRRKVKEAQRDERELWANLCRMFEDGKQLSFSVDDDGGVFFQPKSTENCETVLLEVRHESKDVLRLSIQMYDLSAGPKLKQQRAIGLYTKSRWRFLCGKWDEISDGFQRFRPSEELNRFGIQGQAHSRFIGPFEILERIGEVSYRLALPPVQPDMYLSEEPESPVLIGKREVMRNKVIPFVENSLEESPNRDATWETEESMRASYPHFFI